jgi:hypothetical protein
VCMSGVSTRVYIKRACLSRTVSSSFLSHETSCLSYKSTCHSLVSGVRSSKRSLAHPPPAFTLVRPPPAFDRLSVRSSTRLQRSLVKAFARPPASSVRSSKCSLARSSPAFARLSVRSSERSIIHPPPALTLSPSGSNVMLYPATFRLCLLVS